MGESRCSFPRAIAQLPHSFRVSWSGAIPVTVIFDGSDRPRGIHEGQATFERMEALLREVLEPRGGMRYAIALTRMLTVLGDAASAKERVRSGLEIGDRAPATDVEMKNALDGGMTTIAKAAGEKGTLVEVSSMILIAEGAE